MKKYRQQITSPLIGDCFRACMATVLQLPPEVLPNDHSEYFMFVWERFLEQFGLGLWHNRAEGPIWRHGYWIATVKSLNYKENAHAIVMHDTHKVFHDPSNKKRYKADSSLLGKDVVLSGTGLEVIDATLLHRLEEYRQRINPPTNNLKEGK